MGALYLACQGDQGMEKLCVIKTVLPQLADRQYLARFRDEAKVVVRLSHGNLVPVFDAGIVKMSGSEELYLAMEHVDGKDLRAVWNRCAKKGIAFPVDVACYIARELSRGLYHAHTFDSIKLVHRDVSPPNVLLSYSGEVKLTDFGLAASIMKTERTAPGIVYGKLSYMSPEQARAETLDGRSDLFSVAIILWELLTGRQLFPQGTSELIEKVRNPTIDPPSKHAARVTPQLDAILLKALAPNCDERYVDCEAFRSALAEFLAQTAPTTDNARVAGFLRQLFAEEIDQERQSRQKLLQDAPAERGKLRRRRDDDAHIESLTPMSVMTGHDGGPDGSTAGPGAGSGEDSDDSSLIGKYLDGRYLVKRLIGEGGMGFVYEAEHVEIGRRVAVKVLHALYARQNEVVARFRSEARAAARIGHPHIVDVFDSGTTPEGAVYLVMEHLGGQNLHELLSLEGPLPSSRAIFIGREICEALEAAHRAGILHRDMKPENVFLIDKEGRRDFVKVLDFGIAKSLDQISDREKRLTTPGMAMGTPEYMAPEQAGGGITDARADVYAVGAILYEMLTNRPPHEGKNVMEVLSRKATLAPTPVRQTNAKVSPALDQLIMRTLSILPDDRPQSMAALSEALAAVLNDSAAPSSQLSNPITFKTGQRRPTYVVAGLGAGALAVAATALLVAVQLRPSARAQGRSVPTASPPVAISALPPASASPIVSLPPYPSLAPGVPSPASDPQQAKHNEARRLLQQAHSSVTLGKYAQAEDQFHKVLALAPPKADRAAALTGMAEMAFQHGKHSDALTLARQAVDAGGGVPAKLVLGNAYFKLARYDDAIHAYRDVLKVSKDNPDAQRNLQAAEKRKGL